MNILYVLIPLSLLLGLAFVIGFIVSVRSGQYDDVDTPPYRMLLSDDEEDEKSTPGVD